jgi:glycine cleavage system aminomethyltransferase T
MKDRHVQVRALRSSVGVSIQDHVHLAYFRGDGAWEAADRVFTRELHIRDGQLGHGLLLNDDATLFADCYLGCDDEDFFFLVEGPDGRVLGAWLERQTEGIDELEITHHEGDRAIVGIDGPYAWEMMSRLIGPEVIGLPYMTFFRHGGMLCFRAGKTGEYGYGLVVPRSEARERLDRLLELGVTLDAEEVGLDALDQCALENWFLNIRREGSRGVTPIELQQQWRVSYKKSFVGSEALAARRAHGVSQRLTCLVAPEPLATDDRVRFGDEDIGVVVNAGWSVTRSDWVALALLDLRWAWPGVGPLLVGEREALAVTVAPPVLSNRSLYVNPQIHSYATRGEDEFPPVFAR